MSIQKDSTAFRQPIDVGRSRLRVASETSYPIILIIDRDHQDIGPNGIQWFVSGDQRKRNALYNPEQISPGNPGTDENALQEDDSSKQKFGQENVILATPRKK